MLKNLSRTPSETYHSGGHYFSDYLELMALISNGNPISKADVIDRFLEDDKISVTSLAESGSESDKWDSRILEWFQIIKRRGNLFSDYYPFEIVNNTISSNLRLLNDLTPKHKIYIFLLLNSLQKYIDNSMCSILTSDFEAFSLQSFKRYVPIMAFSYRFGKSGLDYDRYRGHIKDKINLFAEDLNSRTLYEEHFFSETNTGDGGLDIVSWIPFENDTNLNNIQIYLGQCATGKDWLSKKDDTDKFMNYIHFKGDVQHIMFIPYDGRDSVNLFSEEKDMKYNLIFDRQRLLSLLNENEDIPLLNNLQAINAIVDIVIEFEEDII